MLNWVKLWVRVDFAESKNMKAISAFIARIKSSCFDVCLIMAASMALIISALFVHFWVGIPIGSLTRDITAITSTQPFVGFLSQMGIFFWAASAAICLFSVPVLSKSKDNPTIKHFLFASGILSLVLGLDDVFLFHEEIFPSFGVPEKVIFISYAVLVLLYLVRFYSIILKTEYILLAMALVFFAGSIISDSFGLNIMNSYLFEDGLKLVAIVSWLVYFFRTALSAVSHDTTHQGLPQTQ